MRKTFLTITALSLVTLGAAACVSRSEHTKALDSAEVRYNALEAQNASLKNDLADAKKRDWDVEFNSGQELEAVAKKAVVQPPDMIERLKKILRE